MSKRSGHVITNGSDDGGQSPSLSRIRDDAQRACEMLREIANRPPRIVILGEANSGKTTLANRLIGGDLLPASLTSRDSYPTLVRYSPVVDLVAVDRSGRRIPIRSEADLPLPDIARLEVGLPQPRLRKYEVLDAHHQTPAADLFALAKPGTLQIPIWCTVATQAWKLTEQQAWLELARHHRHRAMLAVTCSDRIAETGDRRKLLERLSRETQHEFSALALAPTPWVGTALIEDTVSAHATRLSERRRMVAGRLARRIIRLGNVALGSADLPLMAAI
jgi:hypothetical protein